MCEICREESLEGLQELDCYYCSQLIEIPLIEGLQKLFCYNCPLLTEIPLIEGLHELFCYNCPLLTEIPLIEGLQELYCWNCQLLTKISEIDKLKYYWNNYYCKSDYTKALIKLSKSGCPWLKLSKKRLNKLIILQRYFKKTIMINLLMKQLNDIIEVYYQPGNKGFYLLKEKFDN